MTQNDPQACLEFTTFLFYFKLLKLITVHHDILGPIFVSHYDTFEGLCFEARNILFQIVLIKHEHKFLLKKKKKKVYFLLHIIPNVVFFSVHMNIYMYMSCSSW